jgi:hypothetical protein
MSSVSSIPRDSDGAQDSMPTGSATYILGHQRRLLEQLDTLELELSVIDLKNTFWYSRDNVQSKFQPALPLDKDTENKLVYSRNPSG